MKATERKRARALLASLASLIDADEKRQDKRRLSAATHAKVRANLAIGREVLAEKRRSNERARLLKRLAELGGTP